MSTFVRIAAVSVGFFTATKVIAARPSQRMRADFVARSVAVPLRVVAASRRLLLLLPLSLVPSGAQHLANALFLLLASSLLLAGFFPLLAELFILPAGFLLLLLARYFFLLAWLFLPLARYFFLLARFLLLLLLARHFFLFARFLLLLARFLLLLANLFLLLANFLVVRLTRDFAHRFRASRLAPR